MLLFLFPHFHSLFFYLLLGWRKECMISVFAGKGSFDLFDRRAVNVDRLRRLSGEVGPVNVLNGR